MVNDDESFACNRDVDVCATSQAKEKSRRQSMCGEKRPKEEMSSEARAFFVVKPTLQRNASCF